MRRHLAEPYIWPIDVISDTPLESVGVSHPQAYTQTSSHLTSLINTPLANPSGISLLNMMPALPQHHGSF